MVTTSQLQKMSLKELVVLYNENVPAEKQIKKFRNMETALLRTAGALGTKAAKDKKTKKPKETKEPSERKSKGFTRDAKDVILLHRPGTKRAETIRLLARKSGATIEEVMEKNEWPKRTAYEGITLLHRTLGYGLRQEGNRIFLIGEPTVGSDA